MEEYVKMLDACAGAGHDVSAAKANVTKAASSPPPAPVAVMHGSNLVTIAVEELADIVSENLNARVDPLLRRIGELEDRLKNVESEVAKVMRPRPVVA